VEVSSPEEFNKLFQLADEVNEILQTIQGVKGQVHARVVNATYSLENLLTFLVNRIDDNPDLQAAAKAASEWMLGQMLYAYTMATMKQDPNWSKMCEAEQDDKAQRFLKSIQDDVLTLDKKQKEYRNK
jgi:hypothetical protein